MQSGALLARAHRDPKKIWAAYRRDIRNRLAHGVDPSQWAARCYGGLTLHETGETLGGLDYAAVSIAIKRLEHKAASETDLR